MHTDNQQFTSRHPATRSISPRRSPSLRIGTGLIITALACVPMATLTGCLVGSKNSISESGRRIAPDLLSNITPDQTTETQMLDLLGTPSRTMAADEAGTIYVWDYKRMEDSRGYVFLVFGGSTERVQQQSVSILVRDGIVRKVWQD